MRIPRTATIAIAGVTALAWLLAAAIGATDTAAALWGFIPARFSGLVDLSGAVPAILTPLSSTLVHGGLLHVAFNLLILVFCGRPTEAVLGPVSFGLLYLLGAYAAAAVHYAIDPTTLVPMIGASGAISAVLGAYAILFGRNKVRVTNPKLAVLLNALWLMAAWIVLQLIVVFTFAGFSGGTLQIAIGAHIGGFILGVALANPLLLLRYRKA